MKHSSRRMQKRRISLRTIVTTLCVSFLCSVAGINSAIADGGQHNFEWIKTHGEKTVVELDEGKVDVYVATLSVDPLNKSKQVILYGKLQMPLTFQDFDLEDFDNKTYLNSDSNKVKYNEYVSINLLVSPEDPQPNKYDKTIFQLDQSIPVKGDKVKLVLKDKSFDIPVPAKTAEVDTSYLEGAIAEHWNEYQAALNAGIKLDPATADAYLRINDEARAFVDNAKKAENPPSIEEIEAMRTKLNETYAELLPLPYERDGLNSLIAEAQKKIDQNGANATRYTKDSFDALNSALAKAEQLVSLKDLTTVKVPADGSPLVTHRAFDESEKALRAAIDALQTEPFTQVNLDALKALYDQAVTKTPKEGYTFNKDGIEALHAAIEATAAEIFTAPQYMDEQKVQQLTDALQSALKGLNEVKLDPKRAFKVKVMYAHPTEGGVSPLLKEYFTDEAQNPITETLPVIDGQYVNIPLSDPLVKDFPGYLPTNFLYGSDDGSLQLAKVLRDSSGKQRVVFTATAANLDTGTTLVVFYEKSEKPDTGTTVVEPSGAANAQQANATSTQASKSGKLARTGADTYTALVATLATFLAGASLMGMNSFASRKQRN